MTLHVNFPHGITVAICKHLAPKQWVIESGPIPRITVSEALWEEIKTLPQNFSQEQMVAAFRRVCGDDTGALFVIPNIRTLVHYPGGGEYAIYGKPMPDPYGE